MKNTSYEKERRQYVYYIVDHVAQMIKENSHMSYEEAKKSFINSRVFNYLAYSDEPFIEEGPDDFYDLYVNWKKTGRLVSSTRLYLENHPDLYEGTL